MKHIIFILIFILFTISNLNCDIFLFPIKKTNGYDNYTSNDLYPFGYSKVVYKLDEKDRLRLIEELDIDNYLYQDIYKVET